MRADSKDDAFVLVIDPGHGGKDPGALGKKGKEKNINLAVALLAGKYITQKHPDVKIVYTRKKDEFIELDERADIANKSKANLFISIHTNSSTARSVCGPEVFTFGVSRTKENLEVAKRENSVILLEDNYKEKYEGFDPNSTESYIIFEFMQNKFVEQSIDFASTMQNELRQCVRWSGRGVKQAEYLVLRKSSMPRILIELDFISNPQAEEFLLSESGQKKYAQSICDAFTKYKAGYDRKKGTTKPAVQEIKKEKEPIQVIQAEEEEDDSEDTVPTVVQQRPVSKPQPASSKPIPNKTASSKSIVYKVQILAAPTQLPVHSHELKGYKAGYYYEKGLYKYTYGETSDYNEIVRIRKSLLKDFKDAFIITFKDGVKVQNN
ncbi:N-acetylmuramoyl-L-alanine amidase [Bacteroidia bacterium]|nr:N-acetylmuramoyl-L-alanine amidase [Bacteroidia bacterium]